MGLSLAERKAITRELARRYEGGTKRAKGLILDELCATTGWTRRHARRVLGTADPAAAAARAPRSGRPLYGLQTIGALRRIWAMMGGPCGKRLAPFIEEFIAALERHSEIELDFEVRQQLCRMSAATMDRVLAAERRRLQVRGRHGTKPGTLLKRQIPIRTFAEWDDAVPGFCEVDLVAHDGGVAAGEYCQTLTMTDVSSGWTEMGACANKAQRNVHAVLEILDKQLPFRLRGLDSDNGSEFINKHLVEWCQAREITFTRTRPYRKNDNCFVEQKNWTHVRQQVGYARYDTPAELCTLNELYGNLRLWLNFFAPQQRLVSKTRHGAKVSRRYDTAMTPYQRLMVSKTIPTATKNNLLVQYQALNPAALSREIARLQKKLLASSAAKKRKGVKPPPAHGPLRTFSARQRRVASRTS